MLPTTASSPTDSPHNIITQSPKWQRTNKHKTNHNCSQWRDQCIIHQCILPNFTAVLSTYHNSTTFNTYLVNQGIDAKIESWTSSNDNNNGNSTDTTSTLLAKLESILQTFPEIHNDKILQHLHSLDPIYTLHSITWAIH